MDDTPRVNIQYSSLLKVKLEHKERQISVFSGIFSKSGDKLGCAISTKLGNNI